MVATLLVSFLYYHGSVDEDDHMSNHAFSKVPSLVSKEVAPCCADTMVASDEGGEQLPDLLLHYPRSGDPFS